MKNWAIVFGLAAVLMCGVFFLPAPVYLVVALVAFFVGNGQLNSGPVQPEVSRPRPARPIPAQPSAANAPVQLPKRDMTNLSATIKCPSCGASIKPTAKQCPYCGSTFAPRIELPEPAKLGNLEIGHSVRVNHPQKGAITYRVRGRLLYTELWQATRGPNVPWTPTGNYFAGFPLDQNAYLLNWQERFYLLDERRALTDMDINRDFVPAAKQFAQSNQTAQVEFTYLGGRWQLVDIGRFAVEYEDGEGGHLRKGAIGRFIHATSGNQALVVEDFQSGGIGGQDTLWKGFLVQETDIQF